MNNISFLKNILGGLQAEKLPLGGVQDLSLRKPDPLPQIPVEEPAVPVGLGGNVLPEVGEPTRPAPKYSFTPAQSVATEQQPLNDQYDLSLRKPELPPLGQPRILLPNKYVPAAGEEIEGQGQTPSYMRGLLGQEASKDLGYAQYDKPITGYEANPQLEGLFGREAVGGLGYELTPQPESTSGPDTISRTVGTPAMAPPGAPVALPPIGRDPLALKMFNVGTYRHKDGTISHDPKKQGQPDWETIVAPGADRDKKWSTWDKIASGLVGWATGGLPGAVKAATDRNFFEKMGDQNTRARLLPQIAANQKIAQDDIEYANKQDMIRNRNLQRISEDDRRKSQTQIEMSKEVRAAMTEKRTQYMEKWKLADPNHPGYANFLAEAAANGVTLPAKQPNVRYTTTVAPNGNVVVTNTGTGEYRVGGENLSKPTPINIDDNTFDTMLGIDDPKVYENRAVANISPKIPKGYFDPLVVDAIPADLRNPDGSFNMEKFNAAKNPANKKDKPDERVANITLAQILKNAPDDYKQRVAAETERLRGGQKELREQAAKFRAILKTHRPGADAKPKPLATVIEAFKAIMAMPPKDRESRLNTFYNNYLPGIAIQ
jgi:hypothetical protein